MAQLPQPPDDLEQQAEGPRHAAELAALALFVHTQGEDDPNSHDIALVRSIFGNLISGIAGNALRSAGSSPELEGQLTSLSTTLSDLVAQLAGRDSKPVNELVAMIKNIRRSNRAAPARQPGELSLAREAARNFATWAYGYAIQAVAPVLPKPEHLAANLGLKKTWISQGDSHVRELHRRLHGRTVASDRDFWRWPVTGQALRYPGDPLAPLDATIGCRCLCWLSWSLTDDLNSAIKKMAGTP